MEVLEKNIENIDDEDIFKKFRTKEFKINEEYKYVHKDYLFRICSDILYYCIAYPILKIITKIIYDLKIEGKENIKNIKGGAITISNHVLILDCAMVGLACGGKKIYYTTQESQFKIPFIRRLIKLLRAIPIPTGIKNKEHFINTLEELLKNNNIVHFYPESTLVTYCNKIRDFKNGAFNLAIENKVPIIPMVFEFREVQGIRKLFKNKKDVTLKILKPITYEEIKEESKKVEKLKQIAYENMNKILLEL